MRAIDIVVQRSGHAAAPAPGGRAGASAGKKRGVRRPPRSRRAPAELHDASARGARRAPQRGGAIGALNQLLLLPPNSRSQEAQELVGLAWERAGDLARARRRIQQLYLKLFPEGEGAQRVGAAARVARGRGDPTVGPGRSSRRCRRGDAAAAPARRRGRDRRFTGNVAQYYYGGRARSQSLGQPRRRHRSVDADANDRVGHRHAASTSALATRPATRRRARWCAAPAR